MAIIFNIYIYIDLRISNMYDIRPLPNPPGAHTDDICIIYIYTHDIYIYIHTSYMYNIYIYIYMKYV